MEWGRAVYSLGEAVLVEGALRVQLAREHVRELQLRGVQLVRAARVGRRRALGRHQLAVRLVLHQPVHEVVACASARSGQTERKVPEQFTGR